MILSQLHLTEHKDLASQALELVQRAQDVDGVEPISEQFQLGFRDDSKDHHHLVALEPQESGDPQLLAVAAVEGATAEMVVDPRHRGQGIGRSLLAELDEKKVWAHGNLPAARVLAQESDRVPTRRLLVMRLKGEALESAATYQLEQPWQILDLPHAREQHSAVESEWLRLNNEAFSWHPEQGNWDAVRLEKAQQTEWFRPEDVLFLWDNDEQAFAGFHWVKRHGDLAAGADGEVYVIGLGNAYRRRGLGTPLVQAGLAHLHAAGAGQVLLYVEADNEAAVAAYENLGFEIAEEHVVYAPK